MNISKREQFHKYRIDLKIFWHLLNQNSKRFNIGAGKYDLGDWVCTDLYYLDITKAAQWKRKLKWLKLDNIFAEHVWEHLSDEHTIFANTNCFNFLKPGGKLRIAVPDGFHPDPDYINNVKPGGIGAGAHDHKVLYTYKIMKERLEAVGFTVTFPEYWDENGEFHFNEWDVKEGRVERSKRFDKRNAKGELKYTSLIVDAIKPK
jgi:predicted SAM-dependent methyltransferase